MTATDKEKLDGIEAGSQVNNSYDKTESDGRYLRVDADAPDQTRVAGEVSFAELTTHGKGVNVTGDFETKNALVFRAVSSETQIKPFEIMTNDNIGSIVQSPRCFKFVAERARQEPETPSYGYKFNLGNYRPNSTSTADKIDQIQVFQDFTTGSDPLAAGGVYTFYKAMCPGTTSSNPVDYEIRGYSADDLEVQLGDFSSAIAYGFYSHIADVSTNASSYNFYAAADAPNYFEGNTYIGGTTARNTFELWKSTLTEEQLEQLTAGTLVAPANVSTPGDGEFARQWWYDQQSAEDQALIDAGELDYPEHLAAATFTDTFVLGDNTNINLNSDGSANFKGLTTHEVGVKVTGGSAGSVYTGIYKSTPNTVAVSVRGDDSFQVFNNGSQKLCTFHGRQDAAIGFNVNTATSDFEDSETGKKISIGASFSNKVDADAEEPDGIRSSLDLSGANSVDTYRLFSASLNRSGSANLGTGFYAGSGLSDQYSAETNVGFYSKINRSTIGKQNFGLYFEGTAPSYFESNVGIGTADPQTALHIDGGVIIESIKGAASLGTDADGRIIAGSGGGSGGGTIQNLSYTPAADKGTVVISDGGTDAVIPIATSTEAGLFTGTEKQKLAALSTNTENDSRYLRVDASSPNQTRVSGTTVFSNGISISNFDRIKLNDDGRIDSIKYDSTKDVDYGGNAHSNIWQYRAGGSFKGTGNNNAGSNCPSSFLSEPTNKQTSIEHYAHFQAKTLTNDPGCELTNQYGLFINPALIDRATNNYGIFSRLNKGTNVNYFIYSSGSANSFFQGDIDCNGTITGNFGLRMEADDPAAYNTVTTTDEDGNEVQTEEYTGTSEDLLDIVKDIRSRLAGIEANEIVDDATDNALLTLIGNLAARVSALEAG